MPPERHRWAIRTDRVTPRCLPTGLPNGLPSGSRRLMRRHRTVHPVAQTVGLVAGWGAFPVEVARSLIAEGHLVVCVAIVDHADPQLESICDHVKWSGVGRLGTHLRYFRRHGADAVTMAGKLFKTDLLYSGSVWLRHTPDLTALRTFGPLLFGRRRDTRDDQLLGAVTRTYQNAGLPVCPATDYAPELLVKSEHIAGPKITPKIESDIAAGWRMARAMGGMDVGQTITIKDGTVIAVEAVEGTDACLKRSGELCRRGGWTMVKVAKPDQDMRFDVPTIGPQTVENVARGGGVAIAIEANRTILVQREATIQTAKRNGVSIIAYPADRFEQTIESATRHAA